MKSEDKKTGHPTRSEVDEQELFSNPCSFAWEDNEENDPGPERETAERGADDGGGCAA
jgi:hypothetical protein